MKTVRPECMSCSFLNKKLLMTGKAAVCTKYPKGIPASIISKGGKCPKKK